MDVTQEFLYDLSSSDLILLGEHHWCTAHHDNGRYVQGLLIDNAQRQGKNYQLALGHGDYQKITSTKIV